MTYKHTTRSHQLVARERLVGEQVACFSAACAIQACYVMDGEWAEYSGRRRARDVAGEIGLTRAIGAGDVKMLLNERFSAALELARAGRINVRTAQKAFDERVMAVFKALRTLTILRVQSGEIEPEDGAEELSSFVKSNGRLTATVRAADLNRMASVSNLQQEGA